MPNQLVNGNWVAYTRWDVVDNLVWMRRHIFRLESELTVATGGSLIIDGVQTKRRDVWRPVNLPYVQRLKDAIAYWKEQLAEQERKSRLHKFGWEADVED